jgi:hypothetical protein
MTTKIEEHPLNNELTLWVQSQSPFPLAKVILTLIWEGDSLQDGKPDRPIECRLIFQVTPAQYQQIDTQALFNLKPELRGVAPTADFQPDCPLQITASLKPDRLPDLMAHTNTAETAANYLSQLSQATPDHPLLHTENWLALSVTQQQESGEVSYTTLWATLNPAALTAGTLSEAEISQALTRFFSDWTEANLGALTETATTKILTEVGNFFNELADISIEAIAQTNFRNDSILTQAIHFFTEDDWQFTKLQGESSLSLRFQGENGTWNCYARAREEQQQFVFYSLCPIATPEGKRMAIAHFLTLANYGTLIGNFELDFTDGEIRYKTSIDVEGDRLTPALIKRLIYTNVAMMDQYLPGILAILEQEATPEQAIHLIEQPVSSPQANLPDANFQSTSN